MYVPIHDASLRICHVRWRYIVSPAVNASLDCHWNGSIEESTVSGLLEEYEVSSTIQEVSGRLSVIMMLLIGLALLLVTAIVNAASSHR